ncbi:restriction endonuclease subunit S [Kushneria sp. AK178]
MSSEWPIVTVDEIKSDKKNAISIGPFGSRMKSDCYVDSGVAVIRGTNLGSGPDFINSLVYVSEEKANELASCNAYRGDLVFPHRGAIGEVGIVENDQRYLLSTSLMKLTCDTEKVEPKFVYYFFKSSHGRHELLKNSSQVGTPGIGQPLSSLKAIEIPLPPLYVQKSIANVLGTLDAKIQLNRQINQTLEQMAQALFKSWFVDFEPVKAKIAARKRWQALQPENESASPVCYAAEFGEQPAVNDLETIMNRAAMQAIAGKTAAQLDAIRAEDPERYHELYETAALFPSAMQDSELGEIPEGWNCLSLDQIAKYQNGLALQKFRPENEDDYLPVVKISQLKKGYADGEEKASPNINPECIIDNGDVVFSWSGSLIVDTWCGGRAALNQHLFKVTSSIYPKWLYFHFTRHHLEEFQRIAADKAVTMGHIKREHLKQAFCAVPDAKYLSIGKAIDNMFEKQIDMRLESLTLSQMRDSLLPKLLSGELMPSEAEETHAEATA